MSEGYDYGTAHAMTLEHFGNTEYELYPPEIVRRYYPEWFNETWLRYWEIGR